MISKIFRRNKGEAALAPGDAAFMNDVQESLLAQTTPGSKLVLYLILGVLVSGLVWASYARVEEITQTEA